MPIVATKRFMNECCSVSALWLCFAMTGSVNAAQPGESIVLDSSTGNYIISYCSPDVQPSVGLCTVEQITWVPATKVHPRLRSYLQVNGVSISYGYRLKNEKLSAQSIASFALDPISEVATSVPTTALNDPAVGEAAVAAAIDSWTQNMSIPTGWTGLVVAHPESPGLRAAWLYAGIATNTDGIASGQTQDGFSVLSNDLPGIVTAEVAGNAGEGPSFNDDGPTGDIAQQFQQLQLKNFVERLAAAPAIPVPTPFDRAELLRRIDAQVRTWVALKLLDETFFDQLDRIFQAAISAAARADTKTCGGYAAEIRTLLRKLYRDIDDSSLEPNDQDSQLINRLAARVLDFDLQYLINYQ